MVDLVLGYWKGIRAYELICDWFVLSGKVWVLIKHRSLFHGQGETYEYVSEDDFVEGVVHRETTVSNTEPVSPGTVDKEVVAG